MTSLVSDRAVSRALRTSFAAIGEDIRRLRGDAGITRRGLAAAAGVDPSYLGRIELGTARPSLETCARLALALGADLSSRLYPNTGPLIRDHHQGAIAQSLIAVAHPSWKRLAELAVRRPSRGWIDLGLHHESQRILVATEIQSELRRLEQLIRWSEEKAASVPSWDGWTRLGEPSISRLLVVRETRATTETAREFRRLLRTAYPADPEDALASLTRGDGWPGPALLWAVRERGADRYRILARP
jgi:transcriptional regulator with XRE-family HTH domain